MSPILLSACLGRQSADSGFGGGGTGGLSGGGAFADGGADQSPAATVLLDRCLSNGVGFRT